VASLIKKEKRKKNIFFTRENEKIKAKGIYIVKCKALTKNKKIKYIFNMVPGNLVKTGYQKPGTGTGVPGFWFFQTETRTGTPVSQFFGFSVPGPRFFLTLLS
jgi:hypothetical protein